MHYSTDYVFDGKKEGFYIEEDEPNPLNEYAKANYTVNFLSKNYLKIILFFRTSWVYGDGTQNFLYKLEQWAKERDVLKIAVDGVFCSQHP